VQTACLRSRQRRSASTEADGRFHNLPSAMRVDDDALPLVFRYHNHLGRKARAFDVKLQPVAAPIADGRATHAACALGPAAGDLALAVDRKLAEKVEIVAVAGAAQLKIDFVRCTSHAVVGVAADTFGRTILGLQRSGTAPAARKFGKGAVRARSRDRRDGDRSNHGASGNSGTRKCAEKSSSQGTLPFQGWSFTCPNGATGLWKECLSAVPGVQRQFCGEYGTSTTPKSQRNLRH